MISIKGITLANINIQKDEQGVNKVTGDYRLMSNTDVVLAKQGFNGYSEIQIQFSLDTIKSLNDFSASPIICSKALER